MGEVSTAAHAEQPYAAVRSSVALADIGGILPQHWPRVFGWLAGQGLAPAGAPFIRYLELDMQGQSLVDVAIPTAGQLTPTDDIVTASLPAGRYASMIYTGNYSGLLEANAALQDWGKANEIDWDYESQQNGDVTTERWAARIESYITDPETNPDPNTWQTLLMYKLRD